ncbi:serine/threonine-protein phosphatase [Canibacter sp. lx-45]|uniref:PP2C family protein-serine/threonine phosphatase n=1 Tax=Canibacter zhuwentaonis TaxID=2837491 RepID=UPI001BDD103A|nr:protein phosphatase 2C domain-containing protein [Canibacter zhuwentaonis]MBT1035828.1 serine/threonine-protein phosphatase [Canibacter zhuwentaonis]
MTYSYRSAILSHVGMVRSNNQDSGYTGERLFFVADGMGGHAGGDVASALTAQYVAKIDGKVFNSADAAAFALSERVVDANRVLSNAVHERPELAGLGTTFSGFFTIADKIGIAHIGDSRIYRFRNGELKQITSDHTFVQRLIDSGQITEEEAKMHPRRSVLMRVLGDVETEPEVDVLVEQTYPGDVWLLCSDGLCGYVSERAIRAELQDLKKIDLTTEKLVQRALNNGAPDNVTVALVEVAEAVASPAEESKTTDTKSLPTHRFVGSAANEQSTSSLQPSQKLSKLKFGRKRATPVAESEFQPRVDEYLAQLIAETRKRNRQRRLYWATSLLLVALLMCGAGTLAYKWTQTRYYVGTADGNVVIYQGVKQNIIGIELSHVAEDTGIPLTDLDPFEQRQVHRSLPAKSLKEARDIVLRLGGDLNG